MTRGTVDPHYGIADLELSGALALLYHNAGKFMSERPWHGDKGMAPYERLKIGPAGQG